MEINKIKKLGVIALLLLLLSLSGCKKGEVAEGNEDGENTSVEESVEQPPTDVDTTSKPDSEPSKIEFEFEDIGDDGIIDVDAEVHFIPVGIGDATLIRDHKEYMLVDTGGSTDAVVNYLKEKGVKKLKYFVLTQWDTDSLAGVENLLNTYSVDYIIAPEKKESATPYSVNVKKVLESKGLYVTEPKATKVDYTLGGSTFSLMNRVGNFGSEDDNSMATYFNIGGIKVLLSSDTSKIDEEVKQLGEIDIYSVVRHGDSTVNTKQRIDGLSPKYSVISTNGDDSINHVETDKLLNATKSKVYKTTDGAVVFKINGDGISVNR